jgi:hypothetical protein
MRKKDFWLLSKQRLAMLFSSYPFSTISSNNQYPFQILDQKLSNSKQNQLIQKFRSEIQQLKEENTFQGYLISFVTSK